MNVLEDGTVVNVLEDGTLVNVLEDGTVVNVDERKLNISHLRGFPFSVVNSLYSKIG